MLLPRVMPCLLLNAGGKLVKTVRFKKASYVGDPINAVRIFNEKEVDELIIFDIDASPKKRSINYPLIEKIASECFMPMTYGGGVKSCADFRRLFSLGIEKVSINLSAIETPELISEAAKIFGNQSIIVTVDVKKSFFGRDRVYTNSGRQKTNLTPIEAAQKAESLGAGEIVVNSMDRDGTWEGYDLELLASITNTVNIPVVACGGAGTVTDLRRAVVDAGASAVALGSMVVYQAKDLGVLIKFPKRKELEGLFNPNIQIGK